MLCSPCFLGAQSAFPFGRPSEGRPDLPPFASPVEPRLPVLPPVVIPEVPGTEQATAGRGLHVRAYRFHGNTVLSDAELAQIAQPFTGRIVRYAELQALRDLITLAYVERGYPTSGAVIPDQTVADGVVRIDIVEGVLVEVRVETDGRFQPEFFRDRLQTDLGAVVDVRAIEERLRLLQQDPRVASIGAKLLPGDRRGAAALTVSVREAAPYRVRVALANDEPPSVGGLAGHLYLAHLNPSGWGDRLDAEVTHASGLDELEAHYALPLTPRDLTLVLSGLLSDSHIVDSELRALDIEGASRTFGVALRQPVHRSLNARLDLSLGGELRRSESRLLGRGFSFTAGAKNGVARVSVLRFGQEWSRRSRREVLAARSLLSLGLDAFGATENPGQLPDGSFIAWLGQFQWGRRLDALDAELLMRADVQLSDDPLLGMEQFALGGVRTVRGYRQNAVVRDGAVVTSAEVRVPIHRGPDQTLELAPFADVGHGWNHSGHPGESQTLAGVGLGLIWNVGRNVQGRLQWAAHLKDLERFGEDDLQDRGLHFSLAGSWP